MNDLLTLCIPAKADYILPMRLCVSGIATRAGFSMPMIEDIRTGVSEACILLLKDTNKGEIRLKAYIEERKLVVSLSIVDYFLEGNAPKETETAELSRMIIEAMAKKADFTENKGKYTEVNLLFFVEDEGAKTE